MRLPVMPPVLPMLAKSVKGIPDPAKHDGGLMFEPKWDGFRCIVFRDGDEVVLASRNTKELTRYFPEVVEAVRANLPERCVVDGELFVALQRDGVDRLEFERLQERIHPADSRVRPRRYSSSARVSSIAARSSEPSGWSSCCPNASTTRSNACRHSSGGTSLELSGGSWRCGSDGSMRRSCFGAWWAARLHRLVRSYVRSVARGLAMNGTSSRLRRSVTCGIGPPGRQRIR